MNKDVLLLVTNESEWQERMLVNQGFFKTPITIVHGESTITKSLVKCAAIATTSMFVLIDGDNKIINTDTEHVLNMCNIPTVFFTTNKYGVVYGHGGIKVLNRDTIIEYPTAVDVTAKMGLSVDSRVLSYHQFEHDNFAEWRTIFKELVKLFLWGNRELLRKWLIHEKPLHVFKTDVRNFLRTATLELIQQVITSRELQYALYQQSSSYSDM